MASVRVAVRLRPLNKRELDMESGVVIQMEGPKTRIQSQKHEHSLAQQQPLEQWKEFSFDYSYWSVDKNNPQYTSQLQVFKDLGLNVVDNAYAGYNACVFAYGQTGSGKTYTMMGSPEDEGLIPRICFELFSRMNDENMTYRVEVSYLEIYNEKVRDLLKSGSGQKGAQHSLRVREHPKTGPYVQDLSRHLVQDYGDISVLMRRGSEARTTAATNMNDVSSRSHAIFTIVFTKAKFSADSPLEMHSKIHLVDLAGSERADAAGATGQRLKEGSSINKSLVTLGNVISTLADLSNKSGSRRLNAFIPYRDSVLTWLLKDSLGGNSKTIMIATISPAQCNYAETLSTLRYASRARDIINKPTVNEDSNVKLIRELRAEIARLHALLGDSGDVSALATPRVKERLHENEARIKVLTEEWAGRWSAVAGVLEQEKSLALRRQGLGVVLDSQAPHLIGISDDLLSTGIVLYHLNEGSTLIGTDGAASKQDIILEGPDIEAEHCTIEYCAESGEVTLVPGRDAAVAVNGQHVTERTPLIQGALIQLGQAHMFRFNHPAQAAQLRQQYQTTGLSLSRYSLLSQSMSDLCRSSDNLAHSDDDLRYTELLQQLEQKRHEVESLEVRYQEAERQRTDAMREKEAELHVAKETLRSLEQAYSAQKQQLEGVDLEAEKTRLRELISNELTSLLQAETARIAKALEERGQLAQELESMKRKHEEEKRPLEAERARLEASRDEVTSTLRQLQQQLTDIQQQLQEKTQNLDFAKTETETLQHLKTNYAELETLTSHLSSTVTSQLRHTCEQLMAQKNLVNEAEKRSFETYQSEKREILACQQQAVEDVAKEREQLSADRVYMDDCEEQLMRTFQAGEISSEKYETEKTAIEKERKRIEEEWANLAIIECESEKLTADDSQQLEEKRSKHIEELNVQRNQLKQSESDWKNLVSNVCESQFSEISYLQEGVASLEASLAPVRGSHDEENEKVRDQLQEITEQLQNHAAKEYACTTAWQGVYAGYEDGVATVDRELKSFLAEIADKRQLLEGVDVTAVNSFTELRKLYLLLGLDDKHTPIQDEAAIGADQHLQRIVRQESRVKETEDEHESMSTDCAVWRERQLDALDSERYQLQQLEDQQRIQNLVNQQLRRRALEERMERERERRIDRERDAAERNRQLTSLRRAHEWELAAMQSKIQSSGGLIENTPTRANPYASVMSGDATPVNSRKIKSKSMTNLARTHSSASLHSSPASSSRPISISLPGFVARGAGFNAHIEYEVKITVVDESWAVFRRYNKFYEFHHEIRERFPEVRAFVFPPKRWFVTHTDRLAAERRILLEVYLNQVLELLQRHPAYPLHPSHVRIYSKQVLTDFHPFFRKGVFENSYHATA